jgi:hypothetical protein
MSAPTTAEDWKEVDRLEQEFSVAEANFRAIPTAPGAVHPMQKCDAFIACMTALNKWKESIGLYKHVGVQKHQPADDIETAAAVAERQKRGVERFAAEAERCRLNDLMVEKRKLQTPEMRREAARLEEEASLWKIRLHKAPEPEAKAEVKQCWQSHNTRDPRCVTFIHRFNRWSADHVDSIDEDGFVMPRPDGEGEVWCIRFPCGHMEALPDEKMLASADDIKVRKEAWRTFTKEWNKQRALLKRSWSTQENAKMVAGWKQLVPQIAKLAAGQTAASVGV